MGKKRSLHPSVQEFKKFVKEHPLLVKEVKEGRKSWQDVYEEWTLLGPDHEDWASFKKGYSKKEATSEKVLQEEEQKETSKGAESDKEKENSNQLNIMDLVKKININDLQHHITQFSGVLSNVQALMQTFQGQPNQQQGQQAQQQPQQEDPFSFRQH
ncbi:YlbD family protein [Alkalihalobacillus sp. LMS39]|uniref:YlbD family protein n=1 Tax=Alkalihalobacillus sp. LMS39 TaxID=2924032 RepID=UPI001FB1ADFB|nr:YlbD family protein [Alkalihalobacillus sp. LMS39]UOE92960.1 YlbD family protein [Alkalihalobacillus sp. LMS39]